ncbi:MAG: hypothetical protein J5916_00695 [Oscillospiraceae bacterium]|nr:hypothetical protein [Oscillospiraceae bacterium]
MKGWKGAAVLLVLILALGGILLSRTGRLPGAQREGSTAAEKQSQDSGALRESEESEGENTAGNPEAEAAPPSASPEPTPAPTPTPKPLRPIRLTETDLPEELLRPAEHRGTVLEEDYPTRDMVSDVPDRINKDVTVYLPYGYDPEKQYDVLILLHCAWADHRFWLGQERNYGSEEAPVPVSVPNLLDRMIEEGYCRPLIVVSPCIYLYDRQPSNAGNGYDYEQFEQEIGTDFLPWIAENYGTYAADGSPEALRAAREHFGVLGASFGAYAEYFCVIGENFDLLAWYCFCGGGEIEPWHLAERWTENGTEELPLRMLYICEGEFDDRYGPEISYHNLLTFGGPFNEENVKFTLVQGWGHEDHSYLVGLYNSLQMFFRETEAEESGQGQSSEYHHTAVPPA